MSKDYPLPLIGFAAFSGVGKTTLLKKLLPLLNAESLRVAMIKHAHHRFDVDIPGKDSYELRHAGAAQVLIASQRRTAWICEREEDSEEPHLADLLAPLQSQSLDLVLVEGFKREAFPKIELHRPCLDKPLLYPTDNNIIAIASDRELRPQPRHIPQLDLNRVEAIATFILRRIYR